MELPSFLSQNPPPGYVPGVGRGAIGFSTKGDRKGQAKLPRRLQKPDDNKAEILLSDLEERESDESEAEQVFAKLDARLATRNRSRKSEYKGQQSISHQFADLKRSLATVSEEEWLNMPDAGDYTKKRRRERLDEQLNRKNYAAPDSLLRPYVNLSKLTEERQNMLRRQLDSSIFEKEGENNFNETQEYLNELEMVKISPEVEGEGVERMRTVLKSYRNADPRKPEGWIASARLEERARRMKMAKNIMNKGCLECPNNEDVWLENIRLNRGDIGHCKLLVVQSLKCNPQSLNLWLKAIELEGDIINKHRVVRRSLKELPQSIELWKLAAKYSMNELETRMILEKAVEIIPTSIELCSELIHLQTYEDAKQTLHAAMKSMPLELKVWTLAAGLEETKGEEVTDERLLKLLTKGIKDLREHGSKVTLFQLLTDAERLVNEGNVRAAQALTQAALSECQEESGEFHIISELSDSIVKALALRFLLKSNPTKSSLWSLLKEVCKKIGKMEELYNTFDMLLFDEEQDFRILKENPSLALMYSKEMWKGGHNIPKSLEILEGAQKILPDSLEFWLAKLKLFCFTDQTDVAQDAFAAAVEKFKNKNVPYLEKLYYKYISFLRFLQQNATAIQMLTETCIPNFPNCPNFYIQLGQIHYDMGQIEEARKDFEMGTKVLPHSITPWISLAKIEEIDLKRPARARSILDVGLSKNPNNEILELAKAQMEARLGNYDQARFILQQSLQKSPNSAPLWAENIRILPLKRTNVKKTVFQDALKNTNNGHEILVEIGISFVKDLQYDTAIKWLERATKSNPRYGDSWVWLSRCYKKLGWDIGKIMKEVEIHEPTHGNLWISISKSPATQYYSSPKILRRLLESDI